MTRVLVRPGATFGRWTVLDTWKRGSEWVAKCACACGRDGVVVVPYLRQDARGCSRCAAVFRAADERARERAARVPRWTPEQLAAWALGPFRLEDAQVTS